MSVLPVLPTTSIKSITLQAGETFVLPAGATVTTVLCNGATASSSCDLPACEELKCAYLRLVIDVDENDGHSMDERETYIKSIKVGSETFEINELVIQSGDNPGTLITEAQLNVHLPNQDVFTFTNVTRTVADKRQDIWVYVQYPDSLRETIEMTVTNWGNEQYHRIVSEVVCGTYPNPLPS